MLTASLTLLLLPPPVPLSLSWPSRRGTFKRLDMAVSLAMVGEAEVG